ncbi:MAG: HAMP domain-containing histidine kinase [Ruminococcaceae bacterium]|nr:HAMP domain-containing histidine kinase [Oscillospiraceae bacterium]
MKHKEVIRKQKEKRLHRGIPIKSLRMILTFFVLFVMLVTVALTVVIYVVLELIAPKLVQYGTVTVVSILLASSALGTFLAAVVSKWFLSPLHDMIYATDKIAKGDFKVQLKENFDAASEVGILQRSFNHMARELDGIEMFRKDFINNFSHEFKTPIVSIRGFAHQLQAGGLTLEETQEYVDIIASESDRLAKMATNVLLLSKLENQRIVTDKQYFDLDEQLRTCLLLLEKQWTDKEIELELDLDSVAYCFNEDMLSEVWINLFGNAIKFTPSKGKVACTLRGNAEDVKVCISDTGKGMSEEEISHIFEKFYQGDRSHGGEGNGIGLTIVGRIVELCGGKIQVESRPDMGSVFTVTLPKIHHPDGDTRTLFMSSKKETTV